MPRDELSQLLATPLQQQTEGLVLRLSHDAVTSIYGRITETALLVMTPHEDAASEKTYAAARVEGAAVVLEYKATADARGEAGQTQAQGKVAILAGDLRRNKADTLRVKGFIDITSR